VGRFVALHVRAAPSRDPHVPNRILAMTSPRHAPAAIAVLAAVALGSAGCSGGVRLPRIPSPPAVPTPTAQRAPTTEVYQPLDARQRINDHASRLADGIARWREVRGQGLPQSMRDLALTTAADGRPAFTEILKDHWFQPYAYSPLDEASGRFQLASAGPNGQFGDGDDLTVTRMPGDPRIETYGFTQHPGG
jgi:hypothetical protein